MMKRIIEIIIAFIIILILFPFFLLIAGLIKIETKGPVIYWSKRVGQNSIIFLMPKLRSMQQNTPEVATNIIDSNEYVTNVGKFIRKFSIDELPQLISILKGDMSFIGPRPALFNQFELISQRKKFSIDTMKPGITGWAQINGRDDNTIDEKVKLEKYYLDNKSFFLDIKIVTLTFFYVTIMKNISH